MFPDGFFPPGLYPPGFFPWPASVSPTPLPVTLFDDPWDDWHPGLRFLSITQAKPGWTFTWSGSGPFRVILDGVQLRQTSSRTYTWTGTGFTTIPPPLEVVPANYRALSERFPSRFLAQWYDTPASKYEVQQYLTSWVKQVTLQDTGDWVYTYQSQTIPDGTTVQFRVAGIDQAGNYSPWRNYLTTIVCLPATPKVGVSYANPNLQVVTA